MKYNQDFAGIQVDDEIINRTSSDAIALGHDTILDDASIELWTGAGGTGTQLTEGVDFTLNDLDADLTADAGADIYLTLAIINGTYHSTDIYVSYKTVGDFNDSADVGLTFVDFDISGADQGYTLPNAINAGEQGIRISWSGGDGTYSLTITGTINGYSSWVGQGEGSITIYSDGTDWYADHEGVFDSGTFANGYWERTIAGNQHCRSRRNNTAGGTATWTFPLPFANTTHLVCIGNYNNAVGSTVLVVFDPPSASSVVWANQVASTGIYLGSSSPSGLQANGRWRA